MVSPSSRRGSGSGSSAPLDTLAGSSSPLELTLLQGGVGAKAQHAGQSVGRSRCRQTHCAGARSKPPEHAELRQQRPTNQDSSQAGHPNPSDTPSPPPLTPKTHTHTRTNGAMHPPSHPATHPHATAPAQRPPQVQPPQRLLLVRPGQPTNALQQLADTRGVPRQPGHPLVHQHQLANAPAGDGCVWWWWWWVGGGRVGGGGCSTSCNVAVACPEPVGSPALEE